MRALLKPIKLLNLIVYFLWDLVTSSFQVAWDVVTPRLRAQPKLLLLPMDAKTDGEITLTANLISLTPGTLSLDVSEDRQQLLVHAMFAAKDPDATKRDLKDGIERRVLEVTR
ncbi:MAG: Na+/H+ antiporter subunit E [Rubricella sp.]